MSGNLVLLYLTGGVGSCLGMILLLYNLVAAVLFLREDTEEGSSGMAKAAWAVGLMSLFLWWMPCVGAVVALVAIVLARIERGRIFRDEAPLAGATPVRMGNVDGGIALLLQFLMFVGFVASALGSMR